MMSNQNAQPVFPAATAMFQEDESRILNKIKQSPVLPVATAGFLGIAAYRIYKARERGGMRLSHFLIHTRLAAQGFAVAVLGSLVLYSLGERVYKNVTGAKSSDSN